MAVAPHFTARESRRCCYSSRMQIPNGLLSSTQPSPVLATLPRPSSTTISQNLVTAQAEGAGAKSRARQSVLTALAGDEVVGEAVVEAALELKEVLRVGEEVGVARVKVVVRLGGRVREPH